MTLKNAGNVALEEEVLAIEVINKETADVVKTDQHVFSMQLNEEKEESRILSLNLTDGTYEVKLSYLEKEVAKAELMVSGGLEKDKQVPIKPRVLIQIHKLFNTIADQVMFLQQLFSSFTIENEPADNILESGLKIHKIEHNVHIIFGNLLSAGTREELKARVFGGEGLILIVDKPLNNPHVKELTGVRVRNVSKRKGETAVVVKPGELSSGGEFDLLKNNTLKLEAENSDVEIIAESKVKQYPLISYRKYGRGYVLVLAFPLQFGEGMETISQLLVTAVQRFGQDVYTGSDISRLLPVEFKLTNKTGTDKEYIIKEILPYGVTAYDHVPAPEEGEELKWKITVPAGDTGAVSYWLRLPDQIGSYEVKTEIYEAEAKIDEISLTVDVSQIIMSRIDELITALDNLEVSGKDATNVNKARNHLQNIRNRTEDNLLVQLLNLADTIKADGYLADVENVDVTQIRLQVVNLVKFYSRNIYEALIKLSPLLRNLQLKTMVAGE
jgi:hypothetical protein